MTALKKKTKRRHDRQKSKWMKVTNKATASCSSRAKEKAQEENSHKISIRGHGE